MKKLLTLILMAMTVVGVWSCEQGNEVEVFEKPTDVVNPNPPAPPVDFSKTTLRALAEQVGLKLGVAMTYNEYRQNDSVAVLLKREFNSVTFGNEMKHDAIVGANGKLRFNTADEMVGYAQAAEVELFGHTLGWHSQQQTDYLNKLIEKAAADNSASLLQDNWNFEAGALDSYTASGLEITESYYEVFAGTYAAKAGSDASLAFNVSLEKGKPYILSFWAMSEAEGASVKATLGNQSAETAVDATWAKYSVTFKAKADGAAEYVLAPTAGVCIDNIRVIETEEEDEEKADSYINPYAIGGGSDFENCTAGSDISASGWNAINGAANVSISDAYANSGSLSLLLNNSEGTSNNWDIQALSPTYDVEVGKVYRVAFYLRASVAYADGGWLTIDMRQPDQDTDYSHGCNPTEEWAYYSFDITPAADQVSFAFYGGGDAEHAREIYVDDFQIFEASLEGDYTNYIAKTNMLTGADFEDANAWGIWNGSDYAEFVLRNDPEVGANKDFVHSALRALKVNNIGTGYTGGDSWHIQVAANNKIDVEAGQSYRVAMWVKSPDGANTIQFHLTPDEGDTMYRQIAGITDAWTYIYTDVVIPDGVTNVQLVLDCAYDEATYYIDDVQFMPTPIESYLDPKALAGSTDFDSCTPGSDISASGWNAINGAAKVSITDETANSGKNSLKLNNDEGTSNNWDIQALSPTFPVETGKSYRVAFYMKTDVALSDGGWVTIDMRAGESTDYSHGCNPTEEWTYYSFDITPEVDDVAFAIYGGGDADHARALFVDDFQVFPIESAQGVAPAKNGYGKYRSAGWTRPAPAKTIHRAAAGFESDNKLEGELAEDAIGHAYKSWVYAMVEHFDVYAWDVINETFTDAGNSGFRGANDSALDGDHKFLWGNYFGGQQKFVDMAFEYAKDALAKYGKEAVLYINDYNLETNESKLNALCEYAKSNANVTGVGTQMHLDMTTDGLEAKIENMLNVLVQTGKLVRISELDIKSTDEEAQAALYKYVFQKYMEIVPAAQRGGITIWGFNDKDSWVGESNAPLLWKGNKYDKKAAYEAIYVYLCELAGIDPYQAVEE